MRGSGKPLKLPFPLQTGERVLLVTPRHWLTLVPRFTLMVLFAIVPVAALLAWIGVANQLHGPLLGVAMLGALAWLVLGLLQAALQKYRYDHDLWVVTDRRVVDLESRSPFHFHMSAADLCELEDVSTSRDGVLPSLFDYGRLECQTAGQLRHFAFRDVPDPRGVAALVEREARRARGVDRFSFADAPTERLQRRP